jgi:phosphate transport system permease protein
LAPQRFWVLCALVPVGAWVAGAVGPVMEQGLFAGDFRGWLSGRAAASGRFASGAGGTWLLLLPVAGLGVFWCWTYQVNGWLRTAGRGWSRRQWALVEGGKLAAGLLATALVAAAAAWLLELVGWDPRGFLVDTYVQRNALVVGFVMGFAIIPIIYTVADDALSTVPDHLRAASLGAGATPWQTAARIVIPTAMSGLFSAVMIGLGRAVGETMIVLMAAGNTSIMEINIFNGFQTLSALIATELSEAVRGSTHYRMLFLAALTLFALTFVINTAAEVVRQRFRRRAYEL